MRTSTLAIALLLAACGSDNNPAGTSEFNPDLENSMEMDSTDTNAGDSECIDADYGTASDCVESNIDPMATPGEGSSVYDNIVNNPDLSLLRTVIDTVGIADRLDNESKEWTVFAPSNAAFSSLPIDADLTTLLANPNGLIQSILLYHVVGGTVDSVAAAEEISGGPVDLRTIGGSTVTVAGSASSPFGISVGGIDIQNADSDYDSDTSVGVVHIIGTVLIPPFSTD